MWSDTFVGVSPGWNRIVLIREGAIVGELPNIDLRHVVLVQKVFGSPKHGDVLTIDGVEFHVELLTESAKDALINLNDGESPYRYRVWLEQDKKWSWPIWSR